MWKVCVWSVRINIIFWTLARGRVSNAATLTRVLYVHHEVLPFQLDLYSYSPSYMHTGYTSWGPARQRLNPGTGTRYWWYGLPANIPFLSVPSYSSIGMMVPKSNPLSGSSEKLLEEGDQYRKKSADQDKCNWKYVSGEVVWYLTTDGTGALPILCLLFLLVPFGVMLALKIAGWLWRFLQTPGCWKLSP